MTSVLPVVVSGQTSGNVNENRPEGVTEENLLEGMRGPGVV